jgi:hypothetical protein
VVGLLAVEEPPSDLMTIASMADSFALVAHAMLKLADRSIGAHRERWLVFAVVDELAQRAEGSMHEALD